MNLREINSNGIIFVVLFILWFTCFPASAVQQTFDYSIPVDYDQMTQQLHYFAAQYPEIVSLESLGLSLDGRNVWLLKLGKGNIKFHINGSLHARERITTNIILKNLEEYTAAYYEQQMIEGYYVKALLDQVTIFFVPMANPDGVDYSIGGIETVQSHSLRTQLEGIPLTDDSIHFLPGLTRWKANIRGVDLNRQFPLGWENELYKDPGYHTDSMYKGEAPLTEPESKMLFDLQLNHPFMLNATYHTQGSVLFWYKTEDWLIQHKTRQLAAQVASLTGYESVPTMAPGGGFTDWSIGSLFTPSLTLEFGKNQYSDSDFGTIYPPARALPLLLAEEAIRMDQLAAYEIRVNGDVVKKYEYEHHASGYIENFLSETDQEIVMSKRTFVEKKYLATIPSGAMMKPYQLMLLPSFQVLFKTHMFFQN